MRGPFALEELARLARLPSEEVERYRDAGLLDPDGDGVFDEYDILRLRLVLHYRDLGWTLEDISREVTSGSRQILYADMLYQVAGARVSVDEASDTIGMPPDQILALRTAAGFPPTMVTGDLDMFRHIKGIMDAGVPFDAVVEAARVYGDTLRRLAEAEVRILRFYVTEELARSDLDERARAERLQSVVEVFQGMLDPVVTHVHRMHLLRSAVEDAVAVLDAAEPNRSRGTIDATILFADLASFTPLSEVHGDEVAARILDRYDELVRGLAIQHGGNLVKQIGDAFMLTFADPVDGVRFAIALDEATASEPQFPAVRLGIHTGAVIYRVGDYVGNTVNLASRIAALATAGEILLTKPVAQAAAEQDLAVEPVGERNIQGLREPVLLYRVVRTGLRATRRERDPVCGMTIGPNAAARLLHGGFEFAFCSQDCLKRFLADPSSYVRSGAEDKPIL